MYVQCMKLSKKDKPIINIHFYSATNQYCIVARNWPWEINNQKKDAYK
jgi:hypothetical protein